MEEKSPDNDATLDQQPKCVSKKFVYIPSESAIERAVKIIEEKKRENLKLNVKKMDLHRF